MSPDQAKAFRRSLPSPMDAVADFATVCGVTAATVYRWEAAGGHVPAHVVALASLFAYFCTVSRPQAEAGLGIAAIDVLRHRHGLDMVRAGSGGLAQ